jgi:uncharacterized protein
MKRALLFTLRVYQLTLSRVLVALFGPVCRFQPSCSAYAIACIRDHGPLRGSLLSAKRLCKCHPFHPGGYDPPPPPTRSSAPTEPGAADAEGQTSPSFSGPPDPLDAPVSTAPKGHLGPSGPPTSGSSILEAPTSATGPRRAQATG